MNDRSRRPTSADIVPRLLDAVETLCSQGSPDAATMRAIASEAGVSLGAAYRYFESRDALLGAAMERIGQRLVETAAAHDDPASQLAALWQAMDANPAFARLATWLTMSGRTPTDVMSRHPLADEVMRRSAGQGLADPDGVAAITLFLTLCGSLFRGTVNRAVGRAADDRRLDGALSEMFALWVGSQSYTVDGD